MRYLIAPQELKGTLTAVEAANAIAAALRHELRAGSLELDVLPMADGGPGTAGALLASIGGEWNNAPAHDPLGRPIMAGWAQLRTGPAVVECAAASGLILLKPSERDPCVATTYGTGELIAAAIAAGCRELIVGLGGSATNDGGAGMARAIGYRFLDSSGHELPPITTALVDLASIERPRAPLPAPVHVVGAADVTNPLLGPTGASAMYGPQKGASPATVAILEAALDRLAAVIERDLGLDVRGLAMGGASGGLGAGLVAFLGAELRPGADIVAEATRLDRRASAADLVITGEGRLDGQTVFGKSTARVARAARAAGRPVVCLAGSRGEGFEEASRLFDLVEILEEGHNPAAAIGAAAVHALVRLGWPSR